MRLFDKIAIFVYTEKNFKEVRAFESNIPLTLYIIEAPFNTFTNRADPDQTALVRAA